MSCSCGQHKTEQGCKGARYFSQMSRAERQRIGSLGGNAQAAKWYARLVTRFAHLRRAEAIVAAFQAGLHTRKLRAFRQRHRVN